jgi:hypothetical protein
MKRRNWNPALVVALAMLGLWLGTWLIGYLMGFSGEPETFGK